ncbi:N-acetylglucosamine-6-phosphate deacetylase [Bythopirellula polymerisocia]|uniref:N-acetylglucosamine-6-phosphate deacetylase n=1 Tax=Bythopirellula polymerisocia TaxID=2528003 RepID=A0A5C6D078_9BACT|nr:N-acetylglucosamine-6-phosphate deacetylase [Bythopirellula polymerisocia]TWU30108.1 N-acetylglucosamine-6-phosphate deacetylase [Bythopirellula polymerisocia]
MTAPLMSDRQGRYIDLQVNGYQGVDFNSDQLTAESLHQACEHLAADGIAGILATIITDDIERMASRLSRLATLRAADPFSQSVIWGFHVEGPFILPEPGYVGTHPASAVRPANVDAMQRLLDAAEGLVRIVTLAPEQDADMAVTRMLAAQGICVAAGHCNPSLDELDAAIDAGLTMFTHLGNGCPLELPRHDNIIQRVLSRADQLWISFIADGVHVPWPALGNYLKVTGLKRAIVVTDAISAAGLGPGKYQLGDQSVVVDEQGATWSADRSHLAGSSATMPQLESNLRREIGLTNEEVSRLMFHNPRSALR